MRNLLVLFLAILLAALSFTDDAEARRRGFSFGGSGGAKTRTVPLIIPIPGGGSSSVVFVKDLPDIAVFKFEDKGFYDLGYKFGTFGGGEWVGYFKSQSDYLELDQAKVKQLVLPMIGLTVADTPQRSAGSQLRAGMFWLIAALGVLGILLLRFPGLRRAIFAMQGRKEAEYEVDDRRFAPSEPAPVLQPKPNVATASHTRSPAPAFGRTTPAPAFGKRR